MVKCSFCDAEVEHVGEKEVLAGWGRIKGWINKVKVDVVHCPDDVEMCYNELILFLKTKTRPYRGGD